MDHDPTPEDAQATYVVVGSIALVVGLLFGMKIAGFRFSGGANIGFGN